MKTQKEIDTVIDHAYSYYKTQFNDVSLDPYSQVGFDDYGNHNCIENRVYYFLKDYFRDSQFPVQISNSEYADLDGVEVYHGFEKIDHAFDFINAHDRNHYGVGLKGNGFYVSTSKKDALNYTAGAHGDPSSDRILTLKIVPCRIVEHDDILKALVYIQGGNKNNLQFINLPEEDKQKLDWIREKLLNIFDMDFSECMLSNVSNIALLLEYDALHTKRKNKVDDHLIVLQTNKLFLEENEASRVGNLVENSERN